MKLSEVYTPAVLLDLDILERNIGRFAAEAAAHGKQLWPMLKTHKSLEPAHRRDRSRPGAERGGKRGRAVSFLHHHHRRGAAPLRHPAGGGRGLCPGSAAV